MTKMRSAYCASMLMLLSRTANTQVSSWRSALMWTVGGAAARNLRALLRRFWNSCSSWLGSASTVGSGAWVTTAPLFSIATLRLASTCVSTTVQSVDMKAASWGPTRA